MNRIRDIMTKAPVIPVLVIDDIDHALPLAEALVAGGLPCLEVTLRTPCALDAIARMKQVEGAIVGAGTVLDQQDLSAVIAAGAQFVVSPGLTQPLAHAALRQEIAFLPGVATASELMMGLDLGITHFKFFPAEANGGVPAFKALAAPFKGAQFCPTGGITAETAGDWLAHPQVLCVGGSWVAPQGPVDRAAVEAAARQAASLRR